MADEQAQGPEPVVSNPNMAVEAPPARTDDPAAAPAEAAQPSVTYQASGRPGGFYWGTGRRKTSVARIRLRPGAGKIEVNGRTVEDYFHEPKDRDAVIAALSATDTIGKLDVFANVRGGGFTGQAGAILLGIARALMSVNDAFESILRDRGYLTRDSRMKERKKYGQRGARRRFQFSKR